MLAPALNIDQRIQDYGKMFPHPPRPTTVNLPEGHSILCVRYGPYDVWVFPDGNDPITLWQNRASTIKLMEKLIWEHKDQN